MVAVMDMAEKSKLFALIGTDEKARKILEGAIANKEKADEAAEIGKVQASISDAVRGAVVLTEEEMAILGDKAVTFSVQVKDGAVVVTMNEIPEKGKRTASNGNGTGGGKKAVEYDGTHYDSIRECCKAIRPDLSHAHDCSKQVLSNVPKGHTVKFIQ